MGVQGGIVTTGPSGNYYYLPTTPITFNKVLSAVMIDVDTDKSACSADTSYSWIYQYSGLKFVAKTNLFGVGWLAIGK